MSKEENKKYLFLKYFTEGVINGMRDNPKMSFCFDKDKTLNAGGSIIAIIETIKCLSILEETLKKLDK